MSLSVLCFHRVTDSLDPIGISVDSASFQKLISCLSKTKRILPLKDSFNYIDDKATYYCITFDDGYCDLHDHAIPYLVAFDIPASIFIPSYYTVTQMPFWWEVAAFISSQGIKMPVNESNNKDADIINQLKEMTFYDRELWLSRIDLGNNIKLPGSFSYLELSSLPDNIELCSHGHSHTLCSLMSENDFHEELIKNRELLKDLPNYNSSMFAYPNGTHKDYNSSNKKVLSALNFKAAFTTIDGVNIENNSFDLKRTVVTSKNIDKLIRICKHWKT